MMGGLSVFNRIHLIFRCVERSIAIAFGKGFPPDAMYLTMVNNESFELKQISVRDLVGDGFLWGVPKHRRPIEERWKRKYGSPYYRTKLLLPKKNLKICDQCGHDYEIGVLCPHCYQKICAETKLMQTEIQNKLGLDPVEKDVVVLYEGEKTSEPDEFYQGKIIVEMKKERAAWFSKNLLQKSTETSSTNKEVKPSELG